jgi:large subunit ribosomal protein L22
VPGLKTNEREGTRAVLRQCRMSATKARAVLNLIRGKDVDLASEILRNTPREAAEIVGKLLASAVANAVHNDAEDAEELYVSACYADEGVTLKRWRPRARGRATRIRKRSCHITVIVSRMPEERLVRRRAERQAAGAQRQRRVTESRRRADLSGRLSRRRHAAEVEASLTDQAPQVQFEPDEELENGEELEAAPAGGDETSGEETSGDEASGDEASGDEASGDEATDDEAQVGGPAADVAEEAEGAAGEGPGDESEKGE